MNIIHIYYNKLPASGSKLSKIMFLEHNKYGLMCMYICCAYVHTSCMHLCEWKQKDDEGLFFDCYAFLILREISIQKSENQLV